MNKMYMFVYEIIAMPNAKHDTFSCLRDESYEDCAVCGMNLMKTTLYFVLCSLRQYHARIQQFFRGLGVFPNDV